MRGVTWILLGVLFVVALTATNAQRIRGALERLGAKWTRLHPAVQAAALRVLDRVNGELERRGDDHRVAIFDGWRDLEQQREEIAKGASRLSDPLNGFHVWGLGVDIVFLDAAGQWTWLTDKDPRWDLLTAAYKAEGFEVLAFDRPHGQLRVESPLDLRVTYRDDPLAWGRRYAPEAFA